MRVVTLTLHTFILASWKIAHVWVFLKIQWDKEQKSEQYLFAVALKKKNPYSHVEDNVYNEC